MNVTTTQVEHPDLCWVGKNKGPRHERFCQHFVSKNGFNAPVLATEEEMSRREPCVDCVSMKAAWASLTPADRARALSAQIALLTTRLQEAIEQL